MPTLVPPIRSEEIIALSVYTKSLHGGLSIEEVARREKIWLFDDPGGSSKLAFINPIFYHRAARTPSLVNPRYAVLIKNRREIEYLPTIYLNRRRIDEEHISAEAAFWHEYYHALYSPIERRVEADRGTLSDNFRYRQEERRAHEFAALMMIDSWDIGETAESLARRFRLPPATAAAAERLWRDHAAAIVELRQWAIRE